RVGEPVRSRRSWGQVVGAAWLLLLWRVQLRHSWGRCDSCDCAAGVVGRPALGYGPFTSVPACQYAGHIVQQRTHAGVRLALVEVGYLSVCHHLTTVHPHVGYVPEGGVVDEASDRVEGGHERGRLGAYHHDVGFGTWSQPPQVVPAEEPRGAKGGSVERRLGGGANAGDRRGRAVDGLRDLA